MSNNLYDAAAKIIEEVSLKKKTVKGLCFASCFKRKRILYALVVETLKKKALLLKVIEKCKNIWDDKFDESLTVVLLYETLFGKEIPKEHAHYHVFNENKSILLDAFNDLAKEYPDLCKYATVMDLLPRYVRVNTLKSTMDEVIKQFNKEGYVIVEKSWKDLEKHEIIIDHDIPNLLIFYPNVDFHSHVLYKQGCIILQDKASCLPAFILNPPMNRVMIDACAAPGNKSTHLASLINNKGKIYSFDLDKSRLQLMERMVKIAGASSVKTSHQDFLKVNHKHRSYSTCEYILLDPSCSGSGIVSRLDSCIDSPDETSIKRLESLSGFQTAVLCHALSFPKVKAVVYSTCSIHIQENESVVERAWNRYKDRFSLVHILPNWKNRGIGEWDQAEKCIRAVTESDATNGFFVAMFQRHVSPDVIVNDPDELPVENKTKKRKATNPKKSSENSEKNKVLKIETADFSSTVKRRKKSIKKPIT